MPLRAFAKFIGHQLDKVHAQLYFKNTVPPNEALMSEFDAENKGKDGFLHITYNGNEKGDDAEFVDVRIGIIQFSKSIGLLDPWNHYAHRLKPHDVDAWKVRERGPDHIPVWVGKDASSDIPDIDMKKYNVHRDMPLREFVDFIWLRIQHESPWKKSLFVYFKNTEPPIGTTLMSEVDEKNRDEDGFVRIAYSGKERMLEPLKSSETVAIRPRS
ncbi:hypothetical protein D8674_001998 [Pyrus ussuriensis x Pyrus communis]|uniref:Autophagy-related protein n=1 Tax=Pyrus ussuriensis x Pyrus communis TaxID=2448454 RepID=A0A5N5FDR5_9ROSA|nr:hypothetical protein D8674_001998 [Pyrus ussuriensis x Pyrus communis]